MGAPVDIAGTAALLACRLRPLDRRAAPLRPPHFCSLAEVGPRSRHSIRARFEL